MPELSLIAAEAERLIGHLPDTRRRALAQTLTDVCEARWRELRGDEPATPLAHALWSVTPPLADLFADLYAEPSPQLEQVLQGRSPAWGLALLVRDQIERGESEGARIAYEQMMVSQSAEAAAHYAARIAAALRGQLSPPPVHPHAPQPPLWKALAVIAAHTARCELNAALAVIGLLAAAPPLDESLDYLRDAVAEQGIRFLGIDDHHISYEQHGHPHKAANARQMEEMLIEIRQAWLAHAPAG